MLAGYEEAERVVATLIRRGQTLATAESITGGLIGSVLTAVAGSSGAYRGGFIVYATDLKHTLAGVSSDTLGRDGPVAASTARELADGAAKRCRAAWGLAVTGVAGPDPQDGHPVGQVFVGWSGPGRISRVRELGLSGSRGEIRDQTVREALGGLLLELGRADSRW